METNLGEGWGRNNGDCDRLSVLLLGSENYKHNLFLQDFLFRSFALTVLSICFCLLFSKPRTVYMDYKTACHSIRRYCILVSMDIILLSNLHIIAIYINI